MALTGYWIGGVCSASQAEALALFSGQYPHTESGVMFSVANPIFTTPNNIGAWMQNQNIITGVGGGQWVDFLVTACDPLISPVTLSNIFSVPTSPNVETAWMLGFSLPIICYLVAWGFGIVVNMFDDD